MTNFGGTVIWCHDTEEMLRFYRMLGLEFVEEQHENGPKHWAAQTGVTVLELYRASSISTPRKRLAVGIIVLTDDPKRVMQFLRAGYPDTPMPIDHEQGFNIEDPQGNRIYVVRRHMIPPAARLMGIRTELQQLAEDLRAHPESIPDFAAGLQTISLLNEVLSHGRQACGALSLRHEQLLAEKQKAEGHVRWAEFARETGEMRVGIARPGCLRESGQPAGFHVDEAAARKVATERYGVLEENFSFVAPFVPVASATEQREVNAAHDTVP